MDCGLQIVGLQKVYQDCGLWTMRLEGSTGVLDCGVCTSVSRRGFLEKNEDCVSLPTMQL